MGSHTTDRVRLVTLLAVLTASITASAVAAAPLMSGDVARGRDLYRSCAGCHSLQHDRTGPRHCGIVGRRAAALSGFPYSPAMQSSGIIWTSAALDRFLAAPTQVVPGTTMTYAGVAQARDRQDLIAWLAWAGSNAELCAAPAIAGKPTTGSPADRRR
jgi:cytochrome c